MLFFHHFQMSFLDQELDKKRSCDWVIFAYSFLFTNSQSQDLKPLTI